MVFDKEIKDVILMLLDKRIKEAEKEVREKGMLSEENAVPIILKYQINHVAFLEETIEKRFEQIDKRFEQIDKRFSQLQNWLMGGIAFLSFLIVLVDFLK